MTTAWSTPTPVSTSWTASQTTSRTTPDADDAYDTSWNLHGQRDDRMVDADAGVH